MHVTYHWESQSATTTHVYTTVYARWPADNTTLPHFPLYCSNIPDIIPSNYHIVLIIMLTYNAIRSESLNGSLVHVAVSALNASLNAKIPGIDTDKIHQYLWVQLRNHQRNPRRNHFNESKLRGIIRISKNYKELSRIKEITGINWESQGILESTSILERFGIMSIKIL